MPLIDRCQQAVGREAEGGALETDFTNERDRFVVEMAPAYPVPGLVSAKRTFGLDRTGATSFTIVDEIELERAVEIETALITFGEVSQLSGGSLLVNWNGGSVRITIDTNGEAFTLREEELDEKLPGGVARATDRDRAGEAGRASAHQCNDDATVAADEGAGSSVASWALGSICSSSCSKPGGR